MIFFGYIYFTNFKIFPEPIVGCEGEKIRVHGGQGEIFEKLYVYQWYYIN